MIARLRGEVVEAGTNRLVVMCHGVGYEVFVPETVAAELGVLGETVDLHTRMVVREDDQSLYGFATEREKRLFELLREVKGCGPKASLSVISALGESGAVEAIGHADTRAITAAQGVGPRLADRIVLELKDKVFELSALPGSTRSGRAVTATLPTDELAEALIALGYRRGEIEEAARFAREQSDEVGDQIKIALRRLSQ